MLLQLTSRGVESKSPLIMRPQRNPPMIFTTARMHGGGHGGGADRGGLTGVIQGGECGLRRKMINRGDRKIVSEAFGLLEVGWVPICCMNQGTGVAVTGGMVIMVGAAAMRRADGRDVEGVNGSEDSTSRLTEKVDSTGAMLQQGVD